MRMDAVFMLRQRVGALFDHGLGLAVDRSCSMPSRWTEIDFQLAAGIGNSALKAVLSGLVNLAMTGVSAPLILTMAACSCLEAVTSIRKMEPSSNFMEVGDMTVSGRPV